MLCLQMYVCVRVCVLLRVSYLYFLLFLFISLFDAWWNVVTPFSDTEIHVWRIL